MFTLIWAIPPLSSYLLIPVTKRKTIFQLTSISFVVQIQTHTLCLRIGLPTLALLLSLLFAKWWQWSPSEEDSSRQYLLYSAQSEETAWIRVLRDSTKEAAKLHLNLGKARKTGGEKRGRSFYRNLEFGKQVWGNHNFESKYLKLLLSLVLKIWDLLCYQPFV